jgi:DNA-binding transcriptional LysR family regulator
MYLGKKIIMPYLKEPSQFSTLVANRWPTRSSAMEGIKFRHLQVFVLAAETESLTAAARELGVSQPAVSQSLRELEALIGARLLERSGRRMRVTSAGQAFLGPVRRALAAVRDGVAATGDYRDGQIAPLRVGMGATACIYLMPPVLSLVRSTMPQLRLAISIGNTSDIVRHIETGELDVGLVTLPVPPNPMLTSRVVLRDPLLALVPNEMALLGDAVTASQLSSLPLILYDADGNTRVATDDWFRKASVIPAPVMELGSVEAIKVLVASGLGAAVLPGMALATDVPGAVRKRLRPAAHRSLGVVLRRDRALDRGLRLFVSKLETVASSAI